MRYLTSVLVIGTLTAFLTGCANKTPQNNNVSNKDLNSKPVTIVSSINNSIPPDQARNPATAAKAAMSWKLSDGKTVKALGNSDIRSNSVFGNVAVVALKVPKVTPQSVYYILVMVKKGQLWALKGIIGAPLFKNTKTNSLPSPYSHLISTNISIKGLGGFAEFYSNKTVITLAEITAANSNLPPGKKVILKSGKPVTLFSKGNESGLYYRYGTALILLSGNIPETEVTRIATKKIINKYLNDSLIVPKT